MIIKQKNYELSSDVLKEKMDEYTKRPDIIKSTMWKSITHIKSGLKWPVKDGISNNDIFEIISDPRRTEGHPEEDHQILWVPDFYELEPESFCLYYLHEIIHAQLCEERHLLFSTSVFIPNLLIAIIFRDQDYRSLLDTLFKRAQDWFVDARLHDMHTEHFIKKDAKVLLKKYCDEVRKIQFEKWTKDELFTSGWVYARSDYFKIQKVTVNNNIVNEVINAFKSVNPKQPTIENLQILLNLLLRAINFDLKVELVGNRWELIML